MNRLNIELNHYRNYIFFLLLVVLYLFLDYQTILFLPPQGIHFIRQTDGLSFAENYFRNGLNFFQPQVFNLQSTDGKAACEFPILYYLTAIFYLIFNEHEFILRLITLLITSIGFFYLFKLLYLILNDLVYSMGFTFLFISSTVLLYYTNNYLPDASAFGITLIGWYYFFIYLRNENNKNALILSLVFFTLSSLLKVTYYINPIAAIFSLLTYDILKGIGVRTVIKLRVRSIISFIFSALIILSWNIFVYHYNRSNHDNYFLIHAKPIWSISKNQIAVIFDYISHYWYSKYYYQSTFHTYIFIVIAGTMFLKKAETKILIPSLFLVIGSICYFLLFFYQFMDHDYYFIALIPAIIFITINSFIILRNKFPQLIGSNIVRALLLLMCVLSLNYSMQKLKLRYQTKNDLFSSIGPKLSGIREYIDSIGISKTAKFIIVADRTPNGGLYFIKHSGWSLSDTAKANQTLLKNLIRQGADYILYTDEKFARSDEDRIAIGEKNGVVIYKCNRAAL